MAIGWSSIRDKKNGGKNSLNCLRVAYVCFLNLYPFEETITKPNVTFEDVIENIDIGGVTLIRAASKNHERVTFVCDPSDYTYILNALQSNGITRSKPDPEVFLLEAERLGVSPSACLVVEDADAGVESVLGAGASVLGVGSASNDPRATSTALNLIAVTAEVLLKIG